MNCPLCENKSILEEKILNKKFYNCDNCKLLFLKKTELPSLKDEKNRYLKHNNDIKILKYREYLEKTVEPVLKFINKNSKILDYGSGPEKSLEKILKEKKYKNVESYDPIFFDSEIKKNSYDLIICNQVVEHFHYPMKDFVKIQSFLKDRALLFISTNLWHKNIDLSKWFYLKDFTHVSIFNEETINWLSNCLFSSRLKKTSNNSFILFNEKNGL
jgi:hypothetical protein